MKIGIIGANGFLGSKLVSVLKKNYEVIEIIRDNYKYNIGKKFDILINANGTNKKYYANKFPKEDFQLSVLSVVNSLFDFKYNKYIYISTIDAEKNNDIYGFHRNLAEQLVVKYCKNWLIIRCCAIIGKNAKKGVVYDIINNKNLYLTKNSTLQLITDIDVAINLKKNIYIKNKILNFYSNDNVTIEEIAKILNKKITINKNAKKDFYHYKNTDTKFKNANQYLKDI